MSSAPGRGCGATPISRQWLYYTSRFSASWDYVGGRRIEALGVLRVIGNPESRYPPRPGGHVAAVRFAAKGSDSSSRINHRADPRSRCRCYTRRRRQRMFESAEAVSRGYALGDLLSLLRHLRMFQHLSPLTEKA